MGVVDFTGIYICCATLKSHEILVNAQTVSITGNNTLQGDNTDCQYYRKQYTTR